MEAKVETDASDHLPDVKPRTGRKLMIFGLAVVLSAPIAVVTRGVLGADQAWAAPVAQVVHFIVAFVILFPVLSYLLGVCFQCALPVRNTPFGAWLRKKAACPHCQKPLGRFF